MVVVKNSKLVSFGLSSGASFFALMMACSLASAQSKEKVVKVSREHAIQSIVEAPQVPVTSTKGKVAAPTQSVSSGQLMMKFEDPNPPRDYRREMQIELSTGPFQARGSIRKNVDESVGLGDFNQGRFIQIGLGTSRVKTEEGGGFVPSPWQWGLGARFLLTQQDAESIAAGAAARKLQSASLTFGPWVKRNLTSVWSVGLGLEAGYFNYSQLSPRASERASQGAPIYLADLETAVGVSSSWEVVARGTQRQKMARSTLELPEASWSLGGRYKW